MGITRLNVMMGLAGVYLVRDPDEDALGLPTGDDEIPARHPRQVVRLERPALLPGRCGTTHFMGDTIVVNGVVWPYLQVKRGMYRFRRLPQRLVVAHVHALAVERRKFSTSSVPTVACSAHPSR